MRFTEQHFVTSYVVLYLIGTGIGLILFGILFLIWPELLAYLVSFFFILLGLISIGLGMRIRKTERNIRSKLDSFADPFQKM